MSRDTELRNYHHIPESSHRNSGIIGFFAPFEGVVGALPQAFPADAHPVSGADLVEPEKTRVS